MFLLLKYSQCITDVAFSFTDPMLPSGGPDLIGSSSDAEIDKGHHHDSDLDNSNTA